jgi:hypothetical protein
MSQKNPYKAFVARYLIRGAVGVSVGLAAITPVCAANSPEQNRGELPTTTPFSEKLSKVRSAVSEHLNESLLLAQRPGPRPFPPEPFKNFFGKAPFEDAFRNAPPPKEDK